MRANADHCGGAFANLSMDRAYVIHSLLVDDGACRDINFSEHISTQGARLLLDTLSVFWTLTEATDAEVNT